VGEAAGLNLHLAGDAGFANWRPSYQLTLSERRLRLGELRGICGPGPVDGYESDQAPFIPWLQRQAAAGEDLLRPGVGEEKELSSADRLLPRCVLVHRVIASQTGRGKSNSDQP